MDIHYKGKMFEALHSRHYRYLNEKLKNKVKIINKHHRDFNYDLKYFSGARLNK